MQKWLLVNKKHPVEISFKPIFCQYVFYHLTVTHYLSSLRTETENCKKKQRETNPVEPQTAMQVIRSYPLLKYSLDINEKASLVYFSTNVLK